MDLSDAWQTATTAHEGQVDKLGEPYQTHVARVMARFDFEDLDAKLTAALHDVVEDTSLTLGDLRDAGCPDRVLAAVEAMTKREGEAYDAFIQRVAANPLARRVKAADLCDNSDEQRLGRLPADVADRLRSKYVRAIDDLGVSDLIEEWRRRDRIDGAVDDMVIRGGGKLHRVAAEADADASFACSGGDGEAGRLMVVGSNLVVSGFNGTASYRLAETSFDRVREAVRRGDLRVVAEIDGEYAPSGAGDARRCGASSTGEPKSPSTTGSTTRPTARAPRVTNRCSTTSALLTRQLSSSRNRR